MDQKGLETNLSFYKGSKTKSLSCDRFTWIFNSELVPDFK